jgi:hypothetical protein
MDTNITANELKQLKKYISDTIGLEIAIKPMPNLELNKIPGYLRSTYELFISAIFGREILFAVKNAETNTTADQYKKQNEIISGVFNLPVVFVFDGMASFNRKRIIEKKIAFIIPGRQMYIPFMFLDLKEYKQVQKRGVQKLFPAAQCLLFYGLLNKKTDQMNFEQLAKELGYGKMTITRCAAALSDFNLCKIEGNRNKVLVIERDKNSWTKALPYLINPIAKQFALDFDPVGDEFYYSGDKALSHYTNLNNIDKHYYAVSKNEYDVMLNAGKIKTYDNYGNDYYLQIWKYNPGALAIDKYIDPLSLYAIYADAKDERIESELIKMIEQLW